MRNPAIDFLRGIAAFGIVGCHLLLMSRTDAGWAVTNLCDMNVGVFAALSGYLMAVGHWEGWGAYVRKRAARILPVYFLWTFVFLVFTAAFQMVEGGAVNARYGHLGWWVRVVFWGSSSTHLWFLVSLFYVQALMAGLFRMARSWCWAAASFIVISTSIWFSNWYVTYPVRLLAFLMLGWGLAGVSTEGLKRYRVPLLLLALTCLGLHFLKFPVPMGFVKDWIAVAPLLLAFVAWKDLFSGRLESVAGFLGATSMGVYLIHPLFTKGVGLVVRRMFATPHGIAPVMMDWCVSWLCALGLTLLLLHINRLARWVR